jgi:hypothetical protein
MEDIACATQMSLDGLDGIHSGNSGLEYSTGIRPQLFHCAHGQAGRKKNS